MIADRVVQENERGISAAPLVVFVMLILTAFGLLMMSENAPDLSHAFLRHGPEADLGRECRGNNDALRFQNPETERIMWICMTSNGKWGVWIEEAERVAGKKMEEVTALLKNKMKTLEKVLTYAKNSGYTVPLP
jgi:hypothetical protein